ncbi:MAG: amidase [Actinomycetota bacterium]|jgi:amidase|nr:amidase [Actinomycetota bacterium]
MTIDATASATELAAAIRRKQISSRELLDLFVDRLDRLDGKVNAVVTRDVDHAREAATVADDATARGELTGPLHGLPVTIKDAIATAGIRSTGGAVELTDNVPTEDATVVSSIKAAGAIVFGKTNLPRWSGDLQSYNEIFGTTNNPHDPTRGPGGSSGGAGAAVAAGFTSFEIGTDIGGSVRIPSHFNGVFGLKPSFGVVPQRGYLDHLTGGTTDADINVFGPIARSADDLDLLLDVLVGPPPELRAAWRIDLPPARPTTAKGLRVALWLDDPGCRIDREYKSILESTAAALEAEGAEVIESHPAVDLIEQNNLFSSMVIAAMIPSYPPEAEAIGGSHADWLRNERARTAARRTWAEWFTDGGIDVLLCPVTPTPAFPHDQSDDMFTRTLTINDEERRYLDNVSWTGLIGIAGLPSAVPPIGRTAGGLPVGVQVVAPYLHDRQAIAVARLLGTYAPPPGFE